MVISLELHRDENHGNDVAKIVVAIIRGDCLPEVLDWENFGVLKR